MEKLAAMHPAFLRFPGGNYLEGDHIRALRVEEDHRPAGRPAHPSQPLALPLFGWPWPARIPGVVRRPADAARAGRLCRLLAWQQEHVDPGPNLDPYVQDALDELEYVTGGADTKWGAERVKDGHPEPFKLTMSKSATKTTSTRSGSYEGRYAQFYKAIKAKYPDLQLIATMPVKARGQTWSTTTSMSAQQRSSRMQPITTRLTAAGRRFLSASGPRAKALRRPTSARPWAMPPG
jgi:alpha-N-arabinofuranosidase